MKKLFFSLALGLSLVSALPQAVRIYMSTNDLVSASHNPNSENTVGYVMNTNDMTFRFWFWWPDPAITNTAGPLYFPSLRPGVSGSYVLMEPLGWNRGGDSTGDTYVIYSFLTNYIATNSLAGASYWTNSAGILRPIDLTLPVKITNSLVMSDDATIVLTTTNGTDFAFWKGGTNFWRLGITNANQPFFTFGKGGSAWGSMGLDIAGNAHLQSGSGMLWVDSHQSLGGNLVPRSGRTITAGELAVVNEQFSTVVSSNFYVFGALDGGGHSYTRMYQADTNSPTVFDQMTSGTAGYSRGFSFRTNGVEVFNVTGTGGPSSGANWTAIGATDSSLAGTATANLAWITNGVSYGATYNVGSYGILPDGSDHSDALTNLLHTVYVGGGGTIVFNGGDYIFDKQIALYNDGATIPTQVPIRITGQGNYCYGQGAGAPAGGTILHLRFTGLPAKIDTRGLGTLAIDHLTLFSDGTSGTPFLHDTLTTIYIDHCTFWGKNTGASCDEDAIILGGTTTTVDGSTNAPFQGYGTVIQGNFFNRVRRALYARVYANGYVFRDNSIFLGSGGISAIASCGDNSAPNVGAMISGNLFELPYYSYGITFTNTQNCYLVGNNFYDSTAGLVATHYFDVNSGWNSVVAGFHSPTKPFVTDATAGATSTVFDSEQSATSRINADGSVYVGNLTVGGVIQTTTRMEKISTGVPFGFVIQNDGATAHSDSVLALTVLQSTSGDPIVQFNDATQGNQWNVGMDNSDGDKFKIGYGGTSVGTGDELVIDQTNHLVSVIGNIKASGAYRNVLNVGSTTYIDANFRSQTNQVAGALTLSYCTNGVDGVDSTTIRWLFNSSGSDQTLTFPIIAAGVNGWRTNVYSAVPPAITNNTIMKVILDVGGATDTLARQTNCYVKFEYYQ